MRVISFLFIGLLFLTQVSAANFQVNSLLVKVAVVDGDSVTRTIGITAAEQGIFSFSVRGIPSIELSESQFSLKEGESKNIDLTFDSSKVEPGVYVGSLVISSNGNSQLVPLIFEVESKDIFIDLNVDIPPQYSTIYPGEKVIAQIKLFDLTSGGTSQGLGAAKVNVEYYVYDLDGISASSESETIVVDKQTQLTQSLNFPENVKTGQYVFFAIAKFESSVGVSSHLFSVDDKPIEASKWFAPNLDLSFFAVLVVIVLFFFGMVFFFIYLIKDRDKLILELKDYNNVDLEKQRSLLMAQREALLRKGKQSSEIQEEVNRALEKVKKKHEERVKQFSKLKSSGKVDEMKRKLASWKKAGYSTTGIEYKLKGLSNGEMKSLIDKWRKQYGGRRV